MMSFFRWFNKLSNRVRTSLSVSFSLIGLVSTVLSIIGVSFNDFTNKVWLSLIVLIGGYSLMFILSLIVIGQIYKKSVSFRIKNNLVRIEGGDIFKSEGWKVIGCDNHFDTRVDDVVISKRSLHGQLFCQHGDEKK